MAIGDAGPRRPRHLIFKLLRFQDKLSILRQKRKKLEKEQFFIVDDMTDADLATKRRLAPIIEEAKRSNKKWRYRDGQLWIDGQLYREPRPQVAPAVDQQSNVR